MRRIASGACTHGLTADSFCKMVPAVNRTPLCRPSVAFRQRSGAATVGAAPRFLLRGLAPDPHHMPQMYVCGWMGRVRVIPSWGQMPLVASSLRETDCGVDLARHVGDPASPSQEA